MTNNSEYARKITETEVPLTQLNLDILHLMDHFGINKRSIGISHFRHQSSD